MTNKNSALYQSDIGNLNLLHRGKVRDIYEVDAEYMLIVTSDRISAFDVILPDPIPGKGSVLTTVSNFWFARTQNLIANHLSDRGLDTIGITDDEMAQINARAVVVKKLKPLPVEAIVRGYIIGSGWKDYQNTGMVCGIKLPEGLQQAQQLPEPIFTPSTKAEAGEHDENISFDTTVELLGEDMANKIRDISLTIYKQAADFAGARGIIIADTKFEFGTDENDRLLLIDEALTPDSSRWKPLPGTKKRPGLNYRKR